MQRQAYCPLEPPEEPGNSRVVAWMWLLNTWIECGIILYSSLMFIVAIGWYRLFPHQNLANPELHNPLPTLIAPTALRQYQWTRASDHFLRNLREKRQQRRPHRGVWWSGWRIQGFCMITLVVPRDQRLVFFGDQASRVQLWDPWPQFLQLLWVNCFGLQGICA